MLSLTSSSRATILKFELNFSFARRPTSLTLVPSGKDCAMPNSAHELFDSPSRGSPKRKMKGQDNLSHLKHTMTAVLKSHQYPPCAQTFLCLFSHKRDARDRNPI